MRIRTTTNQTSHDHMQFYLQLRDQEIHHCNVPSTLHARLHFGQGKQRYRNFDNQKDFTTLKLAQSRMKSIAMRRSMLWVSMKQALESKFRNAPTYLRVSPPSSSLALASALETDSSSLSFAVMASDQSQLSMILLS